jgi:hypothetical protein
MSLTPSAGLPKTDCHEGLLYPTQFPLTTLAHPLGPPLPAAVVRKVGSPIVLLQNPPLPNGEEYPAKVESSWPAHESFHGISGT